MYRNKRRKDKINALTMTSKSTTDSTPTTTATTSQPLLRRLSSSSSRSGGDGAGDPSSYLMDSRALENVMNEVWIELGHLGNVDYMKELLEVEDLQKTVANAVEACITSVQQYEVPSPRRRKKRLGSGSSASSSSPRRANHRQQESCSKVEETD